jgi:hypothetical protein
MKSGAGQLVETYLEAGGRLVCPSELVPAPGQYLLAHAPASNAPLAAPIFLSEVTPDGFHIAPPLPAMWMPGTRLNLRGPLGHGFLLPASAQRVALVAFDDSPARLRGLIPLALKQGASVTLLCRSVPDDLPEEVEAQPLHTLAEIRRWADYIAFDAVREAVPELAEMFGRKNQPQVRADRGVAFGAQVLVRAPVPCGGLADCGVCALMIGRDWLMVCSDGPVFDLSHLI